MKGYLKTVTAFLLAMLQCSSIACTIQPIERKDNAGGAKTVVESAGLVHLRESEDTRILEVELDISTYTSDGEKSYHVSITRGDRELNITGGQYARAYYYRNVEGDDSFYATLNLNADCPPLELNILPSETKWHLEDCIALASAGIKAGEADGIMLPMFVPLLEQVIERKFTIDDPRIGERISLSWRRNYRGSSVIPVIYYSDARGDVTIEGDPQNFTLTLPQGAAGFAAKVEYRNAKLTTKALKRAGKGTPDECIVLAALRNTLDRALRILEIGDPGRPSDIYEALSGVQRVLLDIESFDAYGELEEAISSA